MKGGKQVWSCPQAFAVVALPIVLLAVGACAKSTESPSCFTTSSFPFEYSQAFSLLD